MHLGQIIVYSEPGESGISDTAIVLLIVGATIGVPVAIGLALRLLDRRRGGKTNPGEQSEDRAVKPLLSTVLSSRQGQPDRGGRWRESTRGDWVMVGALAAAVVAGYVLSQLI